MKNLWLVFLALFASNVYAQRTVTGNVTSVADGLPLPGVNIRIQGTTTGTVTNFDGEYAISVSEEDAVLEFSFIGFQTKEIIVGDQEVINVALSDDSELLDDVVVTALGIKREKKALGYSVAEVGDEAFESAKSANPMSALSGRLSGVQVSSTAQGAGGSASIIIRGTAIADGSNEPLYVVDGVPISNTNFSSGDDKGQGGIDAGNGMSGIAADDIENISVLKGAAATALYGSRAINGVVMITTKSGAGANGTTVDFSSNTTIDQARIYSDWQREYGQGTYGNAPTNRDESRNNTSMWGARYSDVHNYTDYRGVTSPYQFYDNENDFNNLGVTLNNSVAINHNNDNATLRMSYSNLKNTGMVPNTEYDRSTLTLNGTTKIWNDKMELTAKLSYVEENSTNQAIGESPFAANLMSTPNNVPLSDLMNYKDPVTGMPVGFGELNQNVYWNLNEIKQQYRKDRVITMAQAKYNFNDDLSAMVRYGQDYVIYKSESLWPMYTPWYERGRLVMANARDNETNIDGLLSYNKDFGKWGLTANTGAAMMVQEFDQVNTFESEFLSDSMQRPGFGTQRSISASYRKRQINSLFATAQFRYDTFLYVDLSARNDWSSTLPVNNNSYFYPSISSSLIFTELFDAPSWFTFGKFRASWAQVGSDTDPYMTQTFYNIGSDNLPGWGGDAGNGQIDGNTIPNPHLKPSMNESVEVGIDLKFLNNRVGLDVAYYNSKATDQIVRVAVSPTTGYRNAIVNAGSIQNAGVEATFYAEPVKTNNFSWNTTINYAYNKNKVLDLTEEVNQLTLFESSNVSIVAREGEAYGQILGTKYRRDDEGNIALDETGRPMVTNELHSLGNAYHTTMVGWVNQFQYKNWSATLVVDGKFGGDIYSNTESSAYSTGRHQSTLQRENYREGQVWFPTELGGVGTTAAPQDLYAAVARVDEQFIYDASYLALQEVNLTYHLPATMFEKINFMRSASVGVFARNLGYLWRATDNIDPQASYSIANGGGGVEYGNLALPRNYGFNLNIKF
nr:SusC/RagA family TonB-linked outer membrane protein [uncultured Carboxylicivirga sp.]